jgi:hypothetical protein
VTVPEPQLVGAIHTHAPLPEAEKPGLLTTHQLVMTKGHQLGAVIVSGGQVVVCTDFPT